jgi:nuclear pore complex protein Nup205
LDELQAAALLLSSAADAELLERTPLATAHYNFHRTRRYILRCLLLTLKLSSDDEGDEAVRHRFRRIAEDIVRASHGDDGKGSSLARKCLLAMTDIRKWIQGLEEKGQGAAIIGASPWPEYDEVMLYQRTDLTFQCEDLGVIAWYLVKLSFTISNDFSDLLATVKAVEKIDTSLVYYMPSFIASITKYASPDGSASLADARLFYDKIVGPTGAESWRLRPLRAATILWWLGEYHGWFLDLQEPATPARRDQDAQIEAQNDLFFEVLKDGALDFILSLCSQASSAEAHDATSFTFRQWLHNKAPITKLDSKPCSDEFRVALMEPLETSVDALITNMYVNLRKIRVDQDEKRLRLLAMDPDPQDLDFEKFLAIVTYVFQKRPDAARHCWSYGDSTFYGFLQWSSKRLSTTGAWALCELLIALSEGEENALYAHKFLLNESSSSLGKIRKSNSLSWAQIFQELRYHASQFQDAMASAPRITYRASRIRTQESYGEPETYGMLESYLRLICAIAEAGMTMRSWLLSQTAPSLLDIFFMICGSPVPSSLRACAFDAMRVLVDHESPEWRDSLWISLDQWIFVGPTASQDRSKLPSNSLTPVWKPEVVFERIGEEADEAAAFVSLLVTLVSPYSDDESLDGGLPFPEHLGSAYRMPGVGPYVNFILGDIFAEKTEKLRDVIQKRRLRLLCLRFALSCLSSFNEDLVVFANDSNVGVDSAIRSSSLAAYSRLHPFARVMAWLFNDKFLQALFDTARQDAQEASAAALQSPLVQSILSSIIVMSMALDKQVTYLDILRPLSESSSAGLDHPIANAALSSFEDAVLLNFDLVIYLGQYSATEHPDLILSSLGLLKKLVTSPKQIHLNGMRLGHGNWQSRMIEIFEMNNESHRMSKSLIFKMLPDNLEQKLGPEADAYIVKAHILDFLRTCLSFSPLQPSLAHLLLGFSCIQGKLDIAADSDFAKGASLFSAITTIASSYPYGNSDGLQSWLLNIRISGLEILQLLWSSPLSAIYTMTELRATDFLASQFAQLSPVDVATKFDGLTVTDDDFLLASSAECCELFLRQRSYLLEYAAAEIKLMAEEHAPTFKARVVSALLGTAITNDGDRISTPSILQLFDFAEIDLNTAIAEPELHHFAGVNFKVCLELGPRGIPVHNMAKVEQLIGFRIHEAKKDGAVTELIENEMRAEATRIVLFIKAAANLDLLLHARLEALRSWTKILILIIETGDLDPTARIALILHILQLILPKLERLGDERPTEALELAQLSKVLLFGVEQSSLCSAPEKGQELAGKHAVDAAADQFYQLFLACLSGIYAPKATTELREVYYVICHRYITAVCGTANDRGPLSWRVMSAIRASGEGLIGTASEDAYAGSGLNRVAALLFLDSLVLATQVENSTFVIESLVQSNFVSLLLDTTRAIHDELQGAQARGECSSSRLWPSDGRLTAFRYASATVLL